MASTAAEYKALGNKHLTAGQFDEAITAYTDAISKLPVSPPLLLALS
jgi:cytochrome c-type biogenesis protein CcmH/NrfG